MNNYKETAEYKEAKAAYAQYLIDNQIWKAEDVDALVGKINATIPEGSEILNIEDKKDRAILYFSKYAEATGITLGAKPAGGNTPANVKAGDAATTGNNKPKFVLPDISTGVANAAKENIKNHKEERYQTMLKTDVEKLVWERGQLKDYAKFFPETSVVVNVTDGELAAYEEDLVLTDEQSVKNFKIIKEAVQNKKPLELNLESGAPQPKGAIIKTPKRGEGKEEIGREVKDINALKGFLLGRVPLRIPSKGELGLGIQLAEPRMKDDSQSYGDTISKRYDMKVIFAGKKEAFKNEKYAEFLSEVKTKADGKAETVNRTMSIALAFKVKKRDKDTKEVIEGKTKTIRLKAEVAVPVFQRKNNEIVKSFKSKGASNFISGLESGPDKIANDIAYEKTLLTAISGLADDPKLLGDDFADILSTVSSAKAEGAKKVAGGFDEE